MICSEPFCVYRPFRTMSPRSRVDVQVPCSIPFLLSAFSPPSYLVQYSLDYLSPLMLRQLRRTECLSDQTASDDATITRA